MDCVGHIRGEHRDMKKKLETAEIEVIRFEKDEDVVTGSQTGPTGTFADMIIEEEVDLDDDD